jgi:quinol monooxygenase YgiN
MEFIQLIEYETDHADEMRRMAEEWRAKGQPTGGGPTRITVCHDRERPDHYVTIAEFPSYEVAMANSNRPETHDFATRMAELCKGPPTFTNLDLESREEFSDSSDAF